MLILGSPGPLFGILCMLSFITIVSSQAATQNNVKWCVKTSIELRKCNDIANEVSYSARLKPFYQISCVLADDVIDSMDKVRQGVCDVMVVDAGQLVVAGRNYMLQPILYELYNNVGQYYSVLAVRKENAVNPGGLISYLKGKKVCSPGMGLAAGWILPISKLLQDQIIPITMCNVHLQSVVDFFGPMCVPSALNKYYNEFGMNPNKTCDICAGKDEQRCSFSDPFAGYAGAFRCMAGGTGDIAFLKHTTISTMTGLAGSQYSAADFNIICPDGSIAPPTDYLNCNWGQAEADTIVAYGGAPGYFSMLSDLFTKISAKDFGANATNNASFNVFASVKYNESNVLFSSTATSLEVVGSRDTYVKYVGDSFMNSLSGLEYCPVREVTWCTTSDDELDKCEAMMRASRDRKLRPGYKCVMGDDAQACMQMIKEGDADLIMLDPSMTFVAGRQFNLTPIAAEDFGDNTMYYYAVGVAKKLNPDLTIFNLKARKVCFSGVNRAAGWVVPIYTLVETQQIIPRTCSLYKDLGEFFFRGCAPGAADSKYNPRMEALNLCEACSGGNSDKCQRTSRELYYGDSGAFRCLVESAGEVAFTKALAVLENINGRNPDYWARNRRSDDYELLCRDGKRAPVDQWKTCNLAKLRSSAIVTAGFKTQTQRNIYLELLTYTQHFFSSDTKSLEFHMFDSGENKQDLIFSDSAVKLMPIPPELQNYNDWLGGYFVNLMDSLSRYQCTTGGANTYTSHSGSMLITVIVTLGLAWMNLQE